MQPPHQNPHHLLHVSGGALPPPSAATGIPGLPHPHHHPYQLVHFVSTAPDAAATAAAPGGAPPYVAAGQVPAGLNAQEQHHHHHHNYRQHHHHQAHIVRLAMPGASHAASSAGGGGTSAAGTATGAHSFLHFFGGPQQMAFINAAGAPVPGVHFLPHHHHYHHHHHHHQIAPGGGGGGSGSGTQVMRVIQAPGGLMPMAAAPARATLIPTHHQHHHHPHHAFGPHHHHSHSHYGQHHYHYHRHHHHHAHHHNHSSHDPAPMIPTSPPGHQQQHNHNQSHHHHQHHNRRGGLHHVLHGSNYAWQQLQVPIPPPIPARPGGVDVIDPALCIGKITLPREKVFFTLGLHYWDQGTCRRDLSVCCLFQQGRCHAADHCHQIHADRDYIAGLRRANASPACCPRCTEGDGGMSVREAIKWLDNISDVQLEFGGRTYAVHKERLLMTQGVADHVKQQLRLQQAHHLKLQQQTQLQQFATSPSPSSAVAASAFTAPPVEEQLAAAAAAAQAEEEEEFEKMQQQAISTAAGPAVASAAAASTTATTTSGDAGDNLDPASALPAASTLVISSMCKLFLRGRCRYARDCKWAHICPKFLGVGATVGSAPAAVSAASVTSQDSNKGALALASSSAVQSAQDLLLNHHHLAAFLAAPVGEIATAMSVSFDAAMHEKLHLQQKLNAEQEQQLKKS